MFNVLAPKFTLLVLCNIELWMHLEVWRYTHANQCKGVPAGHLDYFSQINLF